MNAPHPVQTTAPATYAGLEIWSILTSLTTGGAESLVVNLNRCYSDAGARHTVIALCDAETLGNSPDTERRLAEQIVSEGGNFASLGLGRRRNPVSGIRALNRMLRGGAPQVIHAHTARAVPMAAHSRHRGALVFTHHNSRLSFPPVFFRYLDRVVDSYVAISAETEEIYSALCRKPARRISNGVSGDFLAQAERSPPTKPCRIVSVGAVSEQKNYPLLVATAKALKARATGGPPAVFRIAGAGTGLEDLRSEVEQAGLGDMVAFLGERSDVPQLLDAADIFLNTSLYEGQSIAMLEAMAMALPLVATDVPGNRDLVRHEANGLLAPLDQPGAIADAIMRLVNDPVLYARLSAGAHATGRRFSVERTAADHLALYASLVSNG